MSTEQPYTVAIIPARGGSKRIPHKNIRNFCGQPMIAWPIKAAMKSGIFDRVIVSTDSERIAETARQEGAEVPFMRPVDIADDHATTASVVAHALDWLSKNDRPPVYACCLYATAPFVRAEYLTQGLSTIQKHNCSACFSVTTFPFPIYRALQIDNGILSMIWPEHQMTRSQDLPEAYHDAGQFYWIDCAEFAKNQTLYAADARPVLLPRHLVQDIDTEEDFVRAELMFKALANEDQ